MSVLSDRSIKEALASGSLAIEPLDEDAIQPASVDLRLDNAFRLLKSTTRPFVDVREPVEDLTELVTIPDGEPFIIQPGAFCLGSTVETITLSNDLVARVDGKSRSDASAFSSTPPPATSTPAGPASSPSSYPTSRRCRSPSTRACASPRSASTA